MADNDDQLQVGVTPIGQKDEPAPQPAQSPAPRAELVSTPKQQDDSQGTGGNQGATQADLVQHAYELAQRAEADQNKARETYKGMQEDIRRLGRQESENANTPMPTMEEYPEAPNTEQKVVALVHLMMAIPGAMFGGNKYNRGGAISGLQGALNEFKNSGSKKQIAERISLYREQVNITHQQNEDRIKQYQDIMADRRADIHTKLEVIRGLADSYKDINTADAAATDNWEHFSDYLAKVQKMQEDTLTNVYGTMDKLNAVLGNSTEDRLYRSWGAENYPDLRDGLFSMDPRAKGRAVHQLEKRKSFYTWQNENWKWMHPSETAGEKEEELNSPNQKEPPATPPDNMTKAIESMHPDLLFGTPKPGAKKPPEPKSKREQLGYDPRRPFDRSDE